MGWCQSWMDLGKTSGERNHSAATQYERCLDCESVTVQEARCRCEMLLKRDDLDGCEKSAG